MSDLDQILSDEPLTDEIADDVQEDVSEVVEPEQPDTTSAAGSEPAEEAPRDNQVAGLNVAIGQAREEIRALKAQIRTPPVAPEPMPDMLDDPAAYNARIQQEIEKATVQSKLAFSEMMAEQAHGREAIDAALAAMTPQDAAAAMRTPNPYDAAVKWHAQKQIMAEIGDDPAAYKAKLRAEWEAENASNAQKVAETVTQIGNAPSLATETNLGNRNAQPSAMDLSLAQVLGESA